MTTDPTPPIRDFTLSDACGRDGWHSNHSLCAGRAGGGAPCDCPCHPQPIGRVLLDDERSRLTAGEVRERMEEFDRLASEVATLRASLASEQMERADAERQADTLRAENERLVRLTEVMERNRESDHAAFHATLTSAVRYLEASDGHAIVVLRHALGWLERDFPQVTSRSIDGLRGRLARLRLALRWQTGLDAADVQRAFDAHQQEAGCVGAGCTHLASVSSEGSGE